MITKQEVLCLLLLITYTNGVAIRVTTTDGQITENHRTEWFTERTTDYTLSSHQYTSNSSDYYTDAGNETYTDIQRSTTQIPEEETTTMNGKYTDKSEATTDTYNNWSKSTTDYYSKVTGSTSDSQQTDVSDKDYSTSSESRRNTTQYINTNTTLPPFSDYSNETENKTSTSFSYSTGETHEYSDIIDYTNYYVHDSSDYETKPETPRTSTLPPYTFTTGQGDDYTSGSAMFTHYSESVTTNADEYGNTTQYIDTNTTVPLFTNYTDEIDNTTYEYPTSFNHSTTGMNDYSDIITTTDYDSHSSDYEGTTAVPRLSPYSTEEEDEEKPITGTSSHDEDTEDDEDSEDMSPTVMPQNNVKPPLHDLGISDDTKKEEKEDEREHESDDSDDDDEEDD